MLLLKIRRLTARNLAVQKFPTGLRSQNSMITALVGAIAI